MILKLKIIWFAIRTLFIIRKAQGEWRKTHKIMEKNILQCNKDHEKLLKKLEGVHVHRPPGGVQ